METNFWSLLIGGLGVLGALAAWMHKERLEGKEDIIRSKDEVIRAKDIEIELLRRQIQSPSDLLNHVQLIKAASEAELNNLRKQLSNVSESEQARRTELEAKLAQEQVYKVRIEDLAKKLAALQVQTEILAQQRSSPGSVNISDVFPASVGPTRDGLAALFMNSGEDKKKGKYDPFAFAEKLYGGKTKTE